MNERNETTLSASREKKTRQDMGQELNEKQIKAQQEAAKAKRNTVIYTITGIVCAVLTAALLIWNSGFFQNRAAAVRVDGVDYSVGEVQYYYNRLLNQYYTYAQYGIDVGFDHTKDPADQMFDQENNITWHDHLLSEAVDTLAQIKKLVTLAESEGVELSEESRHDVEHTMKDLVADSARSGFSTVNSYLKAAYGRSMNKGKYEKLMLENALAFDYQTAYSEKLTYSDEQLESYYTENKDNMDLFDFNYALIEADDGEDADAAKKAAQDKVEDLRAKLSGGMDFAKAMEAYSEDKWVSSEEIRGEYASTQDEALSQWLLAEDRKSGDVAMILANTSDTAYYVAQFLGRSRDEEVSGDIRHVFVAAEQDADATVPTEEQYEAAKTKAEALLEQWKKGEATEQSFAELAKAESADPGSAENGGLYEQVSSASGFIPEFTQWATDPARKSGDTGLVKNTGSQVKGWHIMYFVGQNDIAWKMDAEAALNDKDTNDWLESLIEQSEIVRLDALTNVK